VPAKHVVVELGVVKFEVVAQRTSIARYIEVFLLVAAQGAGLPLLLRRCRQKGDSSYSVARGSFDSLIVGTSCTVKHPYPGSART
jgi:hypothetical protein